MEDCVNPITKGDDFCINDIARTGPNTPESVLRYRTITGICNNIQTGKATVGAGETVLPRFRRELHSDFWDLNWTDGFNKDDPVTKKFTDLPNLFCIYTLKCMAGVSRKFRI